MWAGMPQIQEAVGRNSLDMVLFEEKSFPAKPRAARLERGRHLVEGIEPERPGSFRVLVISAGLDPHDALFGAADLGKCPVCALDEIHVGYEIGRAHV